MGRKQGRRARANKPPPVPLPPNLADQMPASTRAWLERAPGRAVVCSRDKGGALTWTMMMEGALGAHPELADPEGLLMIYRSRERAR